ncbi:MAG TPA: ParB/RepB/Spo0J family partition protein [Stenomitos sp.]
MLLDIGHITADPGIQPRSRLIPNVVTHFREILNSGAVLDPVSVFNDGNTLWLSDGYHRLEATRQAGFRTINAKIFEGTKRDAILFAIERNANHGSRLTLAERKTAATMLILDHEWQTWSSRKIGRWCGLDHKTVEKIKDSQILQTVSGEIPQIQNFTELVSNSSGIRKAIRQGKIYEIDTSNIGRRSQHSNNSYPFSISNRSPRGAPSLAKIPPSTAFQLCQDPNVIPIRAEELPTFSLLEVAVEEQPLKGDLSQHHLTVVSSGPVYAVPLIFKQMQTHPEFAEIVLQQAQQLASGADCSLIS